MPLEMAFKPPFRENHAYQVFGIVVEVIFVIDVLLMFFTSQISKKGKETTNSQEIAKVYMSQSRFFTDSLAILGNSLFSKAFPWMESLKFFKMVRVLRISGILQRLNIKKEIKARIILVKFVFFLIFWFHLQTCLWWYTIEQNRFRVDYDGMPLKWYPPYDWINFSDSELLSGELSILERYTQTFYVSVLMIGNNELGPVNINEILIAYLLLVVSLFFNSQIFGEIATLIFVINLEQT